MQRPSFSSIVATILVIGALGFGATEAFASVPASSCWPSPYVIGECPPYTQETCDYDCVNEYDALFGICYNGCCECVY